MLNTLLLGYGPLHVVTYNTYKHVDLLNNLERYLFAIKNVCQPPCEKDVFVRTRRPTLS